MRTEFELDLFGDDRALLASRVFSNNLNNGQPFYDDHGLSIERKALELGASAVVGKTVLMDAILARLDEVLHSAGKLPDNDVGA